MFLYFHFFFQSQTRLQLQLAPSLEHQVAAMLSILARYNWQQFSIVTSEIAGHDDFVQAVRDRVAYMKSQELFRYIFLYSSSTHCCCCCSKFL